MKFTHPLLLLALSACDPIGSAPPSSEECPGDRIEVDMAARTCPSEPRTPAPIPTPAPVAGPPRLVVHEWGTFTAVAAADGRTMSWRPLSGPSDLPAFVHAEPHSGQLPRHGKGATAGTIRMETPVIYFYPDRAMEVELSVEFPRGVLTEWFPQTRERTPTTLDWGRFWVEPATADNLASMPEARAAGHYFAGHYFAARGTDAAVVRVAGPGGAEREKFLFYRGVGAFPLSLSVTLDAGKVTLQRSDDGPPGTALVFERRGSQIGLAEAALASGSAALPRPTLDDDVAAVMHRLEQLLVADGLFEREATAMTATWRDHWFEDGLRVFYLLPRAEVDALLPLHLEPAPAQLVRTIVGRIEVLTPELLAAVHAEVTRPGRDAQAACLALRERHGRFAEPAVLKLLQDPDPALDRRPLVEVYTRIQQPGAPCSADR